MARVTVEDCVRMVPNRFDLVLLAAHRARVIRSSADIADGPARQGRYKEPTLALRQIAEDDANIDEIREGCIADLQKLRLNEDIEREADQRALAAKPDISEEDALKAYQAESEAVRSNSRI